VKKGPQCEIATLARQHEPQACQSLNSDDGQERWAIKQRGVKAAKLLYTMAVAPVPPLKKGACQSEGLTIFEEVSARYTLAVETLLHWAPAGHSPRCKERVRLA